jgi:hypothetical protein
MPEANVARTGASSYYKTPKPEPDAARPNAPSYKSRKPLQKIARKKPRRFRGVPPPLTFDIDALPDSTLITDPEVCAIIRRSSPSLQNWRKFPDHPLQWRRVGGRILYELGSVREFLKGDPDKQKPRTKK